MQIFEKSHIYFNIKYHYIAQYSRWSWKKDDSIEDLFLAESENLSILQDSRGSPRVPSELTDIPQILQHQWPGSC